MQAKAIKTFGFFGTAVYIGLFLHTPSFPTPDKILVFATFSAMSFGQAKELLKRFVPFVAMLLIYESFRGLVPGLNGRVNYLFMPAVDRLIFWGQLPTAYLQRLWWQGHVMWYDFVFYGAYMLHFILPFALAAVIWKTRVSDYWRVITAYVTVSFAGFLTFLAFPAAPPWLASEKGLIPPIAHVSSSIFKAFGINDFPSLYNKISPNPVAAVPSLHAAYATLFVLVVFGLYKTKWRYLALIYPVLIWVGTIYMGEHYFIDMLLGIIYAVAGYYASPYVLGFVQKNSKKLFHKAHAVIK